ncbi:MAG: hypothetical protein QM730_10120 [Anaerolineales bacterium]
MLDKKFTQRYSDITKPEYKALFWKSPLAGEGGHKINIGENSNQETIFVAKMVSGTAKDVHNKIANIKTLDFCLRSEKPTTISFHKFGLYEIFLNLYWN